MKESYTHQMSIISQEAESPFHLNTACRKQVSLDATLSKHMPPPHCSNNAVTH